MHQDHGTSPKVCQGAIDLGFGSVMMDGSLMEDGKTPVFFDYNVDVTRKVVDMAHKVGVTVEGELGCLGNLETGDAGEEDGIGAEGKLDHSQMLTDPEEAAQFVKATQLDALAIAIGTSHGAYKFSRQPTGDILAICRVKEIHARIPNTHLVMHGSSSVPQELLAIINQYGGKMKETYGVPVERNPGSHQARRAQDQHRHRHPPGDDRCGAQVPVREPGQVRRPRMAQACPRSCQAGLQAALPGVWLRRPGLQDQGPEPANHCCTVRIRRARPSGELTAATAVCVQRPAT